MVLNLFISVMDLWHLELQKVSIKHLLMAQSDYLAHYFNYIEDLDYLLDIMKMRTLNN